MKHCIRRLSALLLLLALLLTALPLSVSAAGDAMSLSAAEALLNSVPLYPQKTGYEALDRIMEEILAPYADCDTYTKVKGAYDWCVTEINYNWAPYSQTWAPAYDCFNVFYDLSLSYGYAPETLPVPYEAANRTYHALSAHEGICYDYAAAFALLARFIGIEAYIHTGNFVFEQGYGTGSGHHGWTELVLDGASYIFDPQRDYRMSGNGCNTIPYLYFGISESNAWRYTQETGANEQRDSQFLPVTETPRYFIDVTAKATGSGQAVGGGVYDLHESVSLSVEDATGFVGWYAPDGSLLSEESDYTFTVEVLAPYVLWAVFEDGPFFDVTVEDWFYDDVTEAYRRGIANGTEPFRFEAEGTLTRAMAVTMLFRAVGAQVEEHSAPFTDVEADCWYTDAIHWAYAEGVVNGMTETTFAPDVPVSREQLITIFVRYRNSLLDPAESAPLPYEDLDQVSDYAMEALEQAQQLGLITGYTDNTLRPQNPVNRAEGVTLLLRLICSMETAEPA